MIFLYQGYPVRGVGGALIQSYRPSIPLQINGPTGGALVFGLLDTGADDILLPDRLLTILGLTIAVDQQVPLRGIAGATVAANFGTIDIQLRKHRWSAPAAFYPGNRVLLGHSGFLEHFAATFNGRDRTVRLRMIGTPLPSTLS